MRPAPRGLLCGLLWVAVVVQGAAALTCGDSQLPTAGDDTSPAFIPAGPSLVAPGDAPGYNYVVNSSSDSLELWVQTTPGVGTTTTFTRKMSIALSGPGVSSFYNVTSDGGCFANFSRFLLASPPAGVTISTSPTDLSNSATGTTPNCSFNALYSVPWNTFRSSPLNNCGFTISENTTVDNATYRVYTGRVHVLWEDYNSTTATSPVRPNATMWWDVSVQIQVETNTTSAPTNNTEIPYLAGGFSVSQITYSKAENGSVSANIAYQVNTNFPYYAGFPTTHPYDFLVHNGTGATAVYAGLVLGTANSASYPGGRWTHSYVGSQDGQHTANGSPCDSVGDVCSLSGILTFSWKPQATVPASCTMSSNNLYQFDFHMSCNSTYNGTLGQACDQEMRVGLDIPSLGGFKFSGNINFCKSAQTDYAIGWSKPFDVDSQTRELGQSIGIHGVFSTDKKLSAVAIHEFRVSRLDLAGYWSMWNPASDTATEDASTGDVTPAGASTGFVKTIVAADGNKKWSIAASFTPNIRMYSAMQTNFDTVDSRGNYLVSLPNDKGLTLSFQVTAIFRMYADQTQNFGGARRRLRAVRRRRLVYRDQTVPSVAASAVDEMEVKTKPVDMSVPGSVSISKQGTITVSKAPSPGLSLGAIAGIAVIGSLTGVAVVGIGLLVVRRNRRRREADEAAAQAVQEAMSAPHYEDVRKKKSTRQHM